MLTEEQVRAIVREELHRHERGLPVTLSIASQAKVADLLVSKVTVAVDDAIKSPRRR